MSFSLIPAALLNTFVWLVVYTAVRRKIASPFVYLYGGLVSVGISTALLTSAFDVDDPGFFVVGFVPWALVLVVTIRAALRKRPMRSELE